MYKSLLQNGNLIGCTVAVRVFVHIPAGRRHAEGTAAVGIGRVAIVIIGCRHGDDIGMVGRLGYGRLPEIAGCRYNHNIGLCSRLDGVVEDVVGALRPVADITRPPHRQIDDIGAMATRPVEAIGDVGKGAGTQAVEHLDGHDLDVIGKSGHADAVIGALGNRAGNMCAVSKIIRSHTGAAKLAEGVVVVDKAATVQI